MSNTIVPSKSQIIAHTLQLYQLGNTQSALQGLRLLNPNLNITTADVFHAAMQQLQAAYGCDQTAMPLPLRTPTLREQFLFEPHCPNSYRSELALQAGLNRERIQQNFIRGKFSVSTFQGEHRKYITCFSVSGGKLVSASRDWAVKIWDLKTRKCERALAIEGITGKQNYHNLELIKIINGKVYGGDSDSRIYVWDLEKQKILKVFERLDNESGSEEITCISDLNGDLVTTNCTEALIFSSKTHECLRTFRFPDVALNPEEDLAVTYQTVFNGHLFLGYQGGLLIIWDLKTEKCLGHFPSRGDPDVDDRYDIECFAHSNQILIAGLNGGAISLYDWHAGEHLHTFQAHETEVRSLKVYQNWLFSIGYDGMIKMWDLRTAQCLNTFKTNRYVNFDIDQGKIYIADGNKITVLDFTEITPHL